MVELTSEKILVSLDPDWTVSGQGPAASIVAATIGQWSDQLLPAAGLLLLLLQWQVRGQARGSRRIVYTEYMGRRTVDS